MYKSYEILYPETVVQLNYPPNCPPADQPYFEMNLEGMVRAAGIISAEGVYANRELVLWKNGNILPEAFAWPWLVDKLYGPVKERLKFAIKNSIRKKVTVDVPVLWCLDGHSTGGFYHWIVEILPRLWMSRDILKDASIAIPDYFFEKWPFSQEFFKLLGIEKFLILENSNKYFFNNLLLVTRAGSPFYPQKEPLTRSVNWLQERALANIKTSGIGSRVFISRSKANYRKIINEVDLYPILKKWGFEVVCFEDYSLADQINICRHANVLMGLHGAGLTNLAFLPPASKVIEIRPKLEYYSYNFFFILSQYFGINYDYVFCEHIPEPLPTEKRIDDRSVILSPAGFDASLKNILAEATSDPSSAH